MARRKLGNLRKIVTKRTSHVQEMYTNVHVHKLEQRRIKQLEIALKVDAEQEILFCCGSVVVTLDNHDHSHIRFLPDVTKQCQHLRVPQQRSQWLQSNFTQRLRITRERVAGGFRQPYLSAHVGEYAWHHLLRIERVSSPRGVLCPDIQSKKTRYLQ